MKIFKYYRYNKTLHDRFIGVLNGDVWHGSLSLLNDPFEGAFNINPRQMVDFIKTRLIKSGLDNEEIADAKVRDFLSDGLMIKNCIKDLQNKLTTLIFSCSFSENNTSLLMWSHYADEHRGYVVEYEFPDDYNMLSDMGIKNDGYSLVKIKYEESIYEIKWIESFHDAPLILCRKSPEWSYEKELRTVFIDPKLQGSPGFLGKIHPKYIKSICLGMRNTSISSKDITEIRPDIGIFRASPIFGKYALEWNLD